MTARRAINLGLKPTRNYGYIVRIEPPIEHIKNGEDIEGIGWVPMTRAIVKQYFIGWYKHKKDATKRAEDYKNVDN